MEPSEYAGLEASILEEGVRDALIVWNGYIIDGHNRYDICTKHGIQDFRVVEKRFADVEAAKMWIKKNQISRRNIAPYLRGEYFLEVREWEEKRSLAKAQQARKPDVVFQNSEKQPALNTTRELAKTLKVSTDTASRIIQIHENAPEDVKEKARTGEISINEAYHETKRVEAETKGVPHVLHNTGENEWYTPSIYVEAARETMGSIDTDPASCEFANQHIKASTYFDLRSDGRLQPWSGNVWLNPPYLQPQVSEFSDLVVRKFQSGEIKQACVLVNNATETSFFQTMLGACSAICLVKGRIRFIDKQGIESNTPLQGQAILYFGEAKERFKERFRELGSVLYVA